MGVNLKKPNFIHWHDPNELVDHLKQLMASKKVGHTNKDNEI